MTSRTAIAAAALTGLPPKVLNSAEWPTSCCAIADFVMTAATGWPLPIGLPSVTKSGVTPARVNDQSASPVRPWPAWTSSAM